MPARFKLVNLKKPEVIATFETKTEADHALALRQIAFYKVKNNKERPFDYGIVPASATFRRHKCMGFIWI